MTRRCLRRSHGRHRERLGELLEGRSLLAGDLVAQWRADDLNASLADQAAVTSWPNRVATGPAATSTGQPVLAKIALGGRSVVRFAAQDGVDGLTVPSSANPLSNANDFSVAVAFATSAQDLQGDEGPWYQNSGLVDANVLGFGTDWGVTINAAGRLSAGMGNGIGQPSQSIYSDASLKDGQLHMGVLTRNQGTLTLYVDGQLAATTSNASTSARSPLNLSIGKTATGNVGFTGDIAEVRLYNGSLTKVEVTALQQTWRTYFGNSAPQAAPDSYTLPEDASILEALVPAARGVLGNDQDADGDPLTAVLITAPQHGKVTLNADGSFFYDSDLNFYGNDSFTYAAKDLRLSSPVTVALTVTPRYDAAVAVVDQYKIVSGTILSVDAAQGVLSNDTNPDDAPLRAVLVTPPASGQLTLNDNGSFTYDPRGFTGHTAFRYRVHDNTNFSNTVDVTLIVNRPPDAVDDSYTMPEDGRLAPAAADGVLGNDHDADGNALTVALVSSTAHGTLALAPNGSFTYQPEANYVGGDVFTYTANDGDEESTVATVQLNVTAVNDAPVGVNDVYFGIAGRALEVSPARGVLVNDTDVEGQSLTAVLDQPPQQGTVQLQPNGSFVYQPPNNFLGSVTFTYRASDGAAQSAPATVRMAINSLEQQQQVVVNEIHIHADKKTEQVEFIELFNRGTTPVSLAGWTLRSAVGYLFPDNTLIEAGGYVVVAQDPVDFATKFSRAALGPWSGQLNHEGDSVELWTDAGDPIDAVDYQLGFPWPTYGDVPGPSIQLMNPAIDNGLGGSWRSAPPTPGAANSVLVDNAPPSMRQVLHLPNQPNANDPVTVTARVTDTDGVQKVVLEYQIVNPGEYIEQADPAFATQWTPVAMHDDGTAGDKVAADGVYTAVVPPDVQVHRRLVRYRIQASDTLGASRTAPYEDDPQPNFAYFVYNGVPAWTGAVNPGTTPAATFGTDLLNSLPVYQLITKRKSHEDAQFIPNSTRGSGYGGSDYLWEGTLVYDGTVYDHIHFRARGGVWRYAMGKNMWKFDFNRGHSFQARDNRGEKYSTTWDKLNFSAIIQQGDYLHRGEQGLFESVGFQLLNLAGSEAANTNFVHFRIIENPSETGTDQYGGDFQGMYLNVEQLDGRFLDAHNLPDGNFYKIENNAPESIVNQGANQVESATDAKEFLKSFTGAKKPDVTWWRNNLQLDDFYSYQAIAEAIHHYDTAFGKNFYYFHNPETNKWEMKAWDLDLTWADNMFGSAGHEFNVKVAKNPAFNQYTNPANIALNNKLNHEYQNRLREIRDLLYNPEQTGMLIDEMAGFVYQPGQLSFVDADRAKWDYNPLLAKASRYTDNNKNGTRFHYYGAAPTKDFPGMIKLMKDYIVSRGAFLDKTLLTNEANIPQKPIVTYTGAADHPVDGLTFQSSTFQSPIGADFAAMEWRIAEVTDPSAPGFHPYDSRLPRNYEISSTWESGPLASFQDAVRIPAEKLKPGATYRVRVRMKDTDDHWSHWSAPVQFLTTAAGGRELRDGLRISEIQYHPQNATPAERAAGFSDADDFEFLEILNISNKTLPLTGLTLDTITTAAGEQGVSFSFADGAIQQLAPGQRVVVVENQAAFQLRYGNQVPVAGEWSGRLDNGSELITWDPLESTCRHASLSIL